MDKEADEIEKRAKVMKVEHDKRAFEWMIRIKKA
jgi:hypothetical protein